MFPDSTSSMNQIDDYY